MFGFLRRKEKVAPSGVPDFPGASAAIGIVFHQLPLCGLDPVRLCSELEEDDFALGYVFGIADMANHQFNRIAQHDQNAALNYIKHIFVETLGGDGEDRFFQALGRQREPEFQDGRELGADDLRAWLQSEGKRYALGLSHHFSTRNQS